MNFYPLFFTPVYKSLLWGGRNLERIFNRTLPEGDIAESWDICSHKNGMSVVINGELEGKTLEELIDMFGVSIVGKNCEGMDRFPLLIKLIDANDKLSIQVHPGDEYALTAHGDLGKTEMWYVIDAKPDAKLIYGAVPGTSKESFRASILDETIEKHLNYVNVKKGDIFFIPSGTLHAIMDGLVIAEIQQNSDTTYRVYDWGRVDSNGNQRELHIDRALDVIDFEMEGSANIANVTDYDGFSISNIIDCDFFIVDKLIIKSTYCDSTNNDSFIAYTCVEGNGHIEHNNASYEIENGTSFLLPAAMGDYKINGNLTLLKSYIR